MRVFQVSLLSVAMFAAFSATAHHSNYQFDTDAVVTLEGTVTGFEWKNPHIFFNFDTTDEIGDRVNYQVEGDGVGMSAPLGWRRDSLEIGDRITVEASPPTDPRRRSLCRQAMRSISWRALRSQKMEQG